MKLRILLLMFAVTAIAAAAVPTLAQGFPGRDRDRPGERDRDRDRDREKPEKRYPGYEFLATRSVEFRDKSDTIEVGENDGRFSALMIEVEDGHVDMDKIEVTFSDGEKFSPRGRLNFDERNPTREFELPGKGRLIQKVRFDYENRGRRNKAVINLYGKPVKTYIGHEWLGAVGVDVRRSKGTINVTGGEVRCRSLLFETEGAGADLADVEVTFADGDSYKHDETLRFNDRLRLQTLELPGRARVITRVDFTLLADARRGQTTVTMHGRFVIPVDRRYPGMEYLGTATVNMDAERATIDVPRDTGSLTSVLVEVEDFDVDMYDMKFSIERASDRWIPDVRHNFRRDSRARRIDMPGAACTVKQVEFNFKTRRDDRHWGRDRNARIVINLYGRPGDQWSDWKDPKDRFSGHEFLASRTLPMRGDKDVLKCSSDTRFRSLLIEVENGSMEMTDIEIKFLNGEVFTPKVKLDFNDRTRSHSIELPGRMNRAIAEVKFTYRGARGRTSVCLYGKK